MSLCVFLSVIVCLCVSLSLVAVSVSFPKIPSDTCCEGTEHAHGKAPAGYWGPEEKDAGGAHIHIAMTNDIIKQMEVNQNRRLESRGRRLRQEHRCALQTLLLLHLHLLPVVATVESERPVTHDVLVHAVAIFARVTEVHCQPAASSAKAQRVRRKRVASLARAHTNQTYPVST